MNSLQDLLKNGFDEHTAKNMLQGYQERIGTINGIYEVIDINYDSSIKGRNVTLRCVECGRIIHRTIIKGRNKWSELIKTCDCEKERKKRESEISEKNKKACILAEEGNIYGEYVVTGVQFGNPDKLIMNCLRCGSEIRVPYYMISSGRWKNRNCHKHYTVPQEYDETFIGQKNNFLTVIEITRDNSNRKMLVCKCDCGVVKKIQPYHWKAGITKSCGCKSAELLSEANTILEHTEDLDRLRRIYNGMKQRCYNENTDNYLCYGARGIQMCSEWLNDRESFIAWALSHGYSNELSIDRIDVNGNYCPDNCRWADDKTQRRNQRPCVRNKPRKTWTIDGVTKTAKEWCRIYDVSYETVMYRINHKEMSVKEALSMEKMTVGRPHKR